MKFFVLVITKRVGVITYFTSIPLVTASIVPKQHNLKRTTPRTAFFSWDIELV